MIGLTLVFGMLIFIVEARVQYCGHKYTGLDTNMVLSAFTEVPEAGLSGGPCFKRKLWASAVFAAIVGVSIAGILCLPWWVLRLVYVALGTMTIFTPDDPFFVQPDVPIEQPNTRVQSDRAKPGR